MNKMLKLALGAVIASALVVPAAAQSNFPDVPENHWAYESLRNLKDKVLFGYPDGLYRGNRPMSRYEFAVAINQLYQMMMNKDAGLQDQIDALKRMIEGMKPGTDNSAQIAELNGQLEALKRQVTTNTNDIAALRRLTSEFEKELASLGVDVDKAKKDIADLDKRVSDLEKRKPAVDIHGDLNLFVTAGFSRDNTLGINTDGTFTGVGRGSYAGLPVGMTRDLSVSHEAALSISGTNDTGPKWNATLVYGNVLRTLFSQNAFGVGGTLAEGADTMYIQNATVTFDGNLLGKGMAVTLGRFGHKVGPYFFQRPDSTTFYMNDRWDNGNFYLDGGLLAFTFGSVGINVWGGRNSNVNAQDGLPINGMFNSVNGQVFDRTMGADVNFKLGPVNMKGVLITHDSDTLAAGPGGPTNRQTTYGFMGDATFGKIKLSGVWSETNQMLNNNNNWDSDNEAYVLQADYSADKWGGHLGYRRINPFFAAQGDWDRIGVFRNLTGHHGVYGHLWFNASDRLNVFGKGYFFDGNATGIQPGLPNTWDGRTFTVGLNYRINDAFSAMLSYEDAFFNSPVPGGDLKQRWWNVGTHWTMSKDSFFRTMLQIGDHQLGTGPGTAFKGGQLSTQIGIKF